MKLVSIVTPCFNEVENVRELYDRVRKVFEAAEAFIQRTSQKM